jgi:nucleotide-binding universal stress UspA family protein
MTTRTPTRRILLPLDGSEMATIAIPYARALATTDTEVVLVRAIPDPTPMSEIAGTSSFPIERLITRNRAMADDYLAAVADVLGDGTGAVSTASAVGDASEVILGAVHDRHASMVVVASHGRGFLGRVVVGSVADRVARAAPVPVLIIHPSRGDIPVHADSRARVDRLVVPLDGSALAREALPVAASLGHQLGVSIHLVRALPTREELASHPDPVEHGYYEELIAAATETLESEASRLRSTGLEVTTSSLIGTPAATILDELGSHDLVVMTSHGRGGVRRWLLGSVAERLIRSGDAPVLLVPVAERRHLADGKA